MRRILTGGAIAVAAVCAAATAIVASTTDATSPVVPAAAAVPAVSIHAGHAAMPTSAALRRQIMTLNRRATTLRRGAMCPAVRATRKRADALRATALRGRATAKPRALVRKRAQMATVVTLLTKAKTRCTPRPSPAPPAPAPAAPGVPTPGDPAPGAPTSPEAPTTPTPPVPPTTPTPPVVTTTIDLTTHVTLPRFAQSSATAPVGRVRLRLTNTTAGMDHNVGVQTLKDDDRTVIAESGDAAPGETVTVTTRALSAGTYWIFCDVDAHNIVGPMVIPLTIT